MGVERRGGFLWLSWGGGRKGSRKEVKLGQPKEESKGRRDWNRGEVRTE